MREGGKWVDADFVVNGQSLCQRHVHLAITEPGKRPPTYTWDSDSESESEPSLVSETDQPPSH